MGYLKACKRYGWRVAGAVKPNIPLYLLGYACG